MQTLKPLQRRAAFLLAIGLTSRQVSKELKVNKDTLSRWKSDYQFSNLIETHAMNIESDSISAACGLRLRAVEKLGELLEGSPNIALRAATVIFKISEKRQETATIKIDEEQQLNSFNEVLRLIKNHKKSTPEESHDNED